MKVPYENVIWYSHNCPQCGLVETGFYSEPHKGDTFTCNLCACDLLVREVGNDSRIMLCEDFYNSIQKTYAAYKLDKATHKLDKIRRNKIVFYIQRNLSAHAQIPRSREMRSADL